MRETARTSTRTCQPARLSPHACIGPSSLTSRPVSPSPPQQTAAINSIDFHRDGDVFVTSSDDDSVRVYSTSSGEQEKVLFSRSYGCSLVKCTHHSEDILYASRPGGKAAAPHSTSTQAHQVTPPPSGAADLDYRAIRMHDLHDNMYMRYFRGHTGDVTSLSMSPQADVFISGALDHTGTHSVGLVLIDRPRHRARAYSVE